MTPSVVGWLRLIYPEAILKCLLTVVSSVRTHPKGPGSIAGQNETCGHVFLHLMPLFTHH